MISLCLDTLNHFELKIEGNVTKWEKAYVYWEIFFASNLNNSFVEVQWQRSDYICKWDGSVYCWFSIYLW